MSTYAVSDIHGEYERFLDMLERIGLGTSDILYILGDAIDRGNDGVKLLSAIRDMPNVIFLKGNHEDMLLGALGQNNVPFAKKLWLCSGGVQTHRDFLTLQPEMRISMLDWLDSLHEYVEVAVGGRSFYLVHGAPGVDSHTRMWSSVERNADYSAITGESTILFGHTPSWHYHKGSIGKHVRIWHGDKRICLDCGCGHLTLPLRRMGCLRLEDMAEFYV